MSVPGKDPLPRLFLLRHAAAENREAWSGEDSLRPLTTKGERTARSVARAVARLAESPAVVVTSPYTRAAQTAAILAKTLGPGTEVILDERLVAALAPHDVLDILRSHPRAASVFLVGHEPNLSDTAAELCGGGRLRMKKSGVACIEVDDDGRGELAWLAQPDQLVP